MSNQSPPESLPNDFAQGGDSKGSFGNYNAKNGARVPNLSGKAGKDPVSPHRRSDQGQ